VTRKWIAMGCAVGEDALQPILCYYFPNKIAILKFIGFEF
jgi:hypothetical protein